MSWLRTLLSSPPRDAASKPVSADDAAGAENRYYPRLRTGFKFKIFWQDQRGRSQKARARVLDMNGNGALVECGASIPEGSFVYVQTSDVGMMGGAYVRRCETGLFTSYLGLQFSAPLTTRF
ncbi:MAG TPA: hypothetical protein VLX58_20245 [Bryobacteraceae bacterium]|nr:hypothetical protein [Bryobacteraceae bacterium]